MQFIEQITILLCHRMSLHLVGSNRDDATLTNNDAAMSLGAIYMQTEFLGKTIDVTRAINLFHG